MFSLIVLFSAIGAVTSNPELLQMSTKNQCIKSIVYQFITSHTCQKLSQNTKSQLAVKMTNCLFKQMGKQQICTNNQIQVSNDGKERNCKLEGDSWNTFTIFFAHIDNLCHFYWDLSKSERADQMIDALLQSSKRSQTILSQNTKSTKQILQLQVSLRLQILSSIATQQQMSQLLSNSSAILTSITSQLSSSLNKIHSDIKENYSVISRILSTVNQILKNIDILYGFLAAEANSVQGVLFFCGLLLATFGGCLISQKFRIRKNQCLIIICVHFLIEFFLGTIINVFVNIQLIRCISVSLLGIIVVSAKPAFNGIEKTLNVQLNSERMSRIMNKALRNHFQEIKHKILVEKVKHQKTPNEY